MASARRTNPQTFNRYSYVVNNPYSLVDPSGMMACPPGKDCWTDADGDDHWYDDNGEEVITINVRANPAPSAAPPAAGFVAPVSPPTVAPPTTVPPAVAAPGVGRAILSTIGRTIVVPLLATAATITLLPQTVQAPGLPRTTTTTTTDDDDNDPLQRVFRVFGGQALRDGFSWTPIDPRTVPNYRDAAGLPNVNLGTDLVEGDVRNSNIITIKSADRLDGNKGGLTEYVINPANVQNKRETRLLKPL